MAWMSSPSVMASTIITLTHCDAVRRGHPRINRAEGRAIVGVTAGDNVGVAMIRDLAGQYEMEGFLPVPRIQIVSIAQAMAVRDRAVRPPARRGDAFKRAAREEDRGAQGALDF